MGLTGGPGGPAGPVSPLGPIGPLNHDGENASGDGWDDLALTKCVNNKHQLPGFL